MHVLFLRDYYPQKTSLHCTAKCKPLIGLTNGMVLENSGQCVMDRWAQKQLISEWWQVEGMETVAPFHGDQTQDTDYRETERRCTLCSFIYSAGEYVWCRVGCVRWVILGAMGGPGIQGRSRRWSNLRREKGKEAQPLLPLGALI